MVTGKRQKANGNGHRSAESRAGHSWRILRMIAGRAWSGRLLRALDHGPTRFNRLKESMRGVSAKTLSSLLRLYADQGVVVRHVISERPLRVEYSLTQMGRELVEALNELIDWETRWGKRSGK